MLQHNLSADYQKPLATLQWVIENAQADTFTLLFVCCENLSLRPFLVEKLCANLPLKVKWITLAPQIWLGYHTLKKQLGRDRPDILFIDGLETTNDLNAVLRDWNQARDAFTKDFPFPVVIWLNRTVQKQLVRVAKDLESWGTYIDCELQNS